MIERFNIHYYIEIVASLVSFPHVLTKQHA